MSVYVGTDVHRKRSQVLGVSPDERVSSLQTSTDCG
jgi:hypothetical protein